MYGKIEDVKQPEKFTDETIMSYGKWEGSKLIDIPDDYLIWLYKNDRTTPPLKEYIKSSIPKYLLT